MDSAPWGSLSTIRVRLTAALAAALLPVMILGVLQSAIAFRREAVQLREELAAASAGLIDGPRQFHQPERNIALLRRRLAAALARIF